MDISAIPPKQRPSPFRWIWQDDTERLAETGFSRGDLYKVGLQLVPFGLWVLVSITPPTWSDATGGGAGGGHIIEEDGQALPTRSTLNLIDLTVDDTGSSTDVRSVTNRQLWSVFHPVKGISASVVLITDSIGADVGASAPGLGWASQFVGSLYGPDAENTNRDLPIICNFNEYFVTGLTYGGTYSFGNKGPVKQSLVLGVGGSVTFVGDHDYVDVFWDKTSSAGNLEFRRDGVLYRTLTGGGTGEPDACSYPGSTGGTGSHTYEIRAVGAPVEITGLIRTATVPGDGRIYINRMSRSGWSSVDFSDSATLASIVKQGGFSQFLPFGTVIDGGINLHAGSFYVVALGANDCYYYPGTWDHHTTPAQYEANLSSICDAIHTANPYNQIAIMLPAIADLSISGVQDYPMSAYIAGARRVAAHFGSPIIDTSAINFIGRGLYSADGIHPNDRGHRKILHTVAADLVHSVGRYGYKGPLWSNNYAQTTGWHVGFSPTSFVVRPGDGSSTFLPLALTAAKLDDHNATGSLFGNQIAYNLYGSGLVDNVFGWNIATAIFNSSTTLSLLEGYKSSLVNGGTVTERRQFVGTRAGGSGAVGLDSAFYCEELVTGVGDAATARCLNSVGPNTESYHAGNFDVAANYFSYNTRELGLATWTAGVVSGIGYCVSLDYPINVQGGVYVNGVPFSDGTAIHTTASNEYGAVPESTSLNFLDMVLVESYLNGNAKRFCRAQNLPVNAHTLSSHSDYGSSLLSSPMTKANASTLVGGETTKGNALHGHWGVKCSMVGDYIIKATVSSFNASNYAVVNGFGVANYGDSDYYTLDTTNGTITIKKAGAYMLSYSDQSYCDVTALKYFRARKTSGGGTTTIAGGSNDHAFDIPATDIIPGTFSNKPFSAVANDVIFLEEQYVGGTGTGVTLNHAISLEKVA